VSECDREASKNEAVLAPQGAVEPYEKKMLKDWLLNDTVCKTVYKGCTLQKPGVSGRSLL
jgi:hypothetical protein